MSQKVNWIFLGAAGSGKGTQSRRLSTIYRLAHLSTGDLLRAAVQAGTTIGNDAKKYMEKGDLVPDEIILKLLSEHVVALGQRGFILDGFPRTLHQAKALEKMLAEHGMSISRVVYFKISLDDSILRLSGRRICSKCGAIFHLTFAPPQVSGQCDVCLGSLVQRVDDVEYKIRHRYQVYVNQTEPLIAFYGDTLLTLDATKPQEEIFERLQGLINDSH